MTKPVRVFADYHHDCLYESLLILFERWLGWEVYRPTGIEWWQEGLWSYSQNPAIAHQFLDPWPGQSLVRSQRFWVANEVHHPDSQHKLVTLEQFRKLQDEGGWDFILASITEHEHIWQRLADQLEAKAILQVGNVGQPVDWGLSHKVLAAAAIDLPEGRGVRYHPPFSAIEYDQTPPGDPLLITNMMNCLPDAGQAYEDWLALQRLLPDHTFLEYGILGRNGIVGPSSRVAAEMKRAGWAFHNKPQGDGYGFVVHQWASVGRPLIGRHSYYAGKFAGPIMATAVNLDDGIEAAAERIERLSRPEAAAEFAALSRAPRDAFHKAVDWRREAVAIEEYLRR